MVSIIRILLVAALLLLSGNPLAAAGVELEIRLGLDGQRVHGPWTHMTVIVDNQQDAIQGELQLFLGDPPANRPDYVYPVQSLPGSRQAYPVALPTNLAQAVDDSPFDGIISEFAAKDRSLAVTVRLVAADAVLTEKSTVIEEFLLPEQQILVVGQQAVGYDFLRVRDQQRVVYARTSSLPMDWAALRGLTAMIAADSDLRQLDRRQQDALAMWLRSGGRLLVTGANLRQSAAAPWLQDMLPFTAQPASPVAASGITGSLQEFLDFDANEQLSVLSVDAIGGEVLAEVGTSPLVIRQMVGQGSLHILAFDPTRHSIERWPAKVEFFQQLLAVPRGSFLADDVVVDGLTRAMLHSIPASGVGRAEIFLALALLIVFVSGAFFVGMRFSLPVLTVVVVAAVVLHGAIVYQWLGQGLVTSQTKLLETAIFRKHALEAQSMVDSYLLFNSHSELSGSFSIQRRVGSFAPLTHEADVLLRQNVSLRAESDRWRALIQGTELPLSQGVRTQYLTELPIFLAADWDEQRITISNQSVYTLERMYLFTEDGYYALFSLNPHTERTVQVASRQAQSHPPWTYRQQLWEPIRWQQYLESGIFQSLRDRAVDQWGARRFLVAGLSGPPPTVYENFSGERLFQGFLIIPVI